MKEIRTYAKVGGRFLKMRMDKESIHLCPVGKHWDPSGVTVAIATIFKLGRRQRGAENARAKGRYKRLMRKLRRQQRGGDDGDGVALTTEEELFLLAHLGRRQP